MAVTRTAFVNGSNIVQTIAQWDSATMPTPPGLTPRNAAGFAVSPGDTFDGTTVTPRPQTAIDTTVSLPPTVFLASAPFESAVRAQRQDQMTAPAAAVDWAGQRLTGLGAAILATDTARADQSRSWVRATAGWARVSNVVFAVGSDITNIIGVGSKLKWSESAVVKYGVVKSAVFSAGSTVVTMIATSDYVMTVSPDANSAFYASPGAWPDGFPAKFTWAPVAGDYTGFSVAPTPFGCWWKVHEGMIELNHSLLANGTSNATTFTIATPISGVSGGSGASAGSGIDAGSSKGAGVSQAGAAASVSLFPLAQAAWTASGAKGAAFLIKYPIA